MSNDKEPASEKEQAIWMANNLLDEPNADPDDDARTISRQFLRALEEITRLKAELERERELRKELINACEGVIRLRQLLEFTEDVVGAAYEGEAVAINRMIFVIENVLEKAKN